MSFTCISCAIDSLSERISPKFRIPSTFLKVLKKSKLFKNSFQILKVSELFQRSGLFLGMNNHIPQGFKFRNKTFRNLIPKDILYKVFKVYTIHIYGSGFGHLGVCLSFCVKNDNHLRVVAAKRRAEPL